MSWSNPCNTLYSIADNKCHSRDTLTVTSRLQRVETWVRKESVCDRLQCYHDSEAYSVSSSCGSSNWVWLIESPIILICASIFYWEIDGVWKFCCTWLQRVYHEVDMYGRGMILFPNFLKLLNSLKWQGGIFNKGLGLATSLFSTNLRV